MSDGFGPNIVFAEVIPRSFPPLDGILLLAEVKHLESLLGGLDTAEGHGTKSRA